MEASAAAWALRMMSEGSAASELRRSVSDASKRIGAIIDEAETAAAKIRGDAQEDAKQRAQRSLNASAAELSAVVGPLIERVEKLREDAGGLMTELQAVTDRLRTLAEPGSIDLPTVPVPDRGGKAPSEKAKKAEDPPVKEKASPVKEKASLVRGEAAHLGQGTRQGEGVARQGEGRGPPPRRRRPTRLRRSPKGSLPLNRLWGSRSPTRANRHPSPVRGQSHLRRHSSAQPRWRSRVPTREDIEVAMRDEFSIDDPGAAVNDILGPGRAPHATGPARSARRSRRG